MRALLASLAVVLLAAPSVAQTPPPGTRQIKLDVSPAGQAVLKRYLGAPDPGMRPLAEQMAAVSRQMVALADGQRLDLARVQVLLRRQESLQAAMVRRSNDRTLAMLTALPEPDRLKFLRSLRAARPGSPSPK